MAPAYTRVRRANTLLLVLLSVSLSLQGFGPVLGKAEGRLFPLLQKMPEGKGLRVELGDSANDLCPTPTAAAGHARRETLWRRRPSFPRGRVLLQPSLGAPYRAATGNLLLLRAGRTRATEVGFLHTDSQAPPRQSADPTVRRTSLLRRAPPTPITEHTPSSLPQGAQR